MSDLFTVRVRLPRQLNDDVDLVLRTCGLTRTTAVRALFVRIARERKLPFEIHEPTDDEIAAARLDFPPDPRSAAAGR